MTTHLRSTVDSFIRAIYNIRHDDDVIYLTGSKTAIETLKSHFSCHKNDETFKIPLLTYDCTVNGVPIYVNRTLSCKDTIHICRTHIDEPVYNNKSCIILTVDINNY